VLYANQPAPVAAGHADLQRNTRQEEHKKKQDSQQKMRSVIDAIWKIRARVEQEALEGRE
jgi:hypothetical protein